MILCGGFIVPIIGFIIPILADIKYNLAESSNGQLFFKIFLLIIALVINGMFVLDIFGQNK